MKVRAEELNSRRSALKAKNPSRLRSGAITHAVVAAIELPDVVSMGKVAAEWRGTGGTTREPEPRASDRDGLTPADLERLHLPLSDGDDADLFGQLPRCPLTLTRSRPHSHPSPRHRSRIRLTPSPLTPLLTSPLTSTLTLAQVL